MDPYNPFTSDEHLEHVSGWKFVGLLAVLVPVVIVTVWAFALFFLNLEKVYTAWMPFR